MKNEKKVREYWGYYFIFEDATMIDRFIDLFEDDILDYEKHSSNKSNWLKVVCGKGSIPKIRKALGDMIETKGHGRYLVKAA